MRRGSRRPASRNGPVPSSPPGTVAGPGPRHTTPPPGVSISSDPTDRPAVRGPSADGVPAVPGPGSGGVVDPTPVASPQAAPADGLPPAGTPSPDGAGVPLAG